MPLPAATIPASEPPRRRFWIGWIMLVLLLAALAAVLMSPNRGRQKRALADRVDSLGSIRALAVLPFQNLSSYPEQEYFVDGMTDAVIGELARMGGATVISRTSSMLYKNAKKPLPTIARELGVDALVEGTVLRSGNRVRITVQLIRADTDRHVFSESYERDLGDVLLLQSDIARSVALQVRKELSEQARLVGVHPVNPAAYLEYLQGRYQWNKRTKEGFENGLAHFKRAIAKDPAYALAYSGLADCYFSMSSYLPPGETRSAEKAALLQALELDNGLAEVHCTLAHMKEFEEGDWPAAEREYRRSLELNPNYATAHHWYSFYLASMGRLNEALAESRRAQEIEPLTPVITSGFGFRLYFARQYDKAVEQCQKALEMDPNLADGHFCLGHVYEQRGMYAESVTEYKTALSIAGDDLNYVGALGHAYALSRQRRQALSLADKLMRSPKGGHALYAIGLIYAGLGDQDTAFSWLERAASERPLWLRLAKVDPALDNLRSHPRFQGLIRKLRLPE
jgi:TolB-like protein/Tfp pilus assembly protein PilF